jgi:transglutaminase-like putative cysteine protease
MVVSHIQTDGTAQATGDLMRAMVEKYHTDMLPYVHLSLPEVFDLIKSVPFQADPVNYETLQRPNYTMTCTGLGGDCDDKSIALASYCRLLGIPCKFVAVRRADHAELHHVMCYVYLNRQWIPADPTYRVNALGRERERYAEYVTI